MPRGTCRHLSFLVIVAVGKIASGLDYAYGPYRTGAMDPQPIGWPLDHGGVSGLQPKACVLLIGNNNMFFVPETGVEAAAQGIKTCLLNLREKFPEAAVVVVKILPAHAPGVPFYEHIKQTNAAIDDLKLTADPKVQLLDLTADLVHADGTLKHELFSPDTIHLRPAGYGVYARRLRPLLEGVIGAGGGDSGGKPAAAAPSVAP